MEDGELTLNFTIEDSDNCQEVELTAASYTKPYEGYIFERRGEQVLLDFTTDTYGPGNYSVTVEVPE